MIQIGHTGNVRRGGLLGLSLSEAPSISTAAMSNELGSKR